MKKLMIAAGAAALVCTSSLAAVAAEQSGIVSDLSWSLGTLTLDESRTYHVPPWVRADLPQICKGDRVTVIYDEAPTGGLPMVTDVRPATS